MGESFNHVYNESPFANRNGLFNDINDFGKAMEPFVAGRNSDNVPINLRNNVFYVNIQAHKNLYKQYFNQPGPGPGVLQAKRSLAQKSKLASSKAAVKGVTQLNRINFLNSLGIANINNRFLGINKNLNILHFIKLGSVPMSKCYTRTQILPILYIDKIYY